MRRNNTAPPGPVCRCVHTAMVQPRIGNWLSNPVSGPPSSGATTVIVAVTPPAIAIRAGRSQRGGLGNWARPAASRGISRSARISPR